MDHIEKPLFPLQPTFCIQGQVYRWHIVMLIRFPIWKSIDHRVKIKSRRRRKFYLNFLIFMRVSPIFLYVSIEFKFWFSIWKTSLTLWTPPVITCQLLIFFIFIFVFVTNCERCFVGHRCSNGHLFFFYFFALKVWSAKFLQILAFKSIYFYTVYSFSALA